MFVFEDERISRAFNSEIIKTNSITINNIKKIVESAAPQVIKSKEILDDRIKYNLEIKEYRLAQIRIDFPEYSLQELADEYNKEYETSFSKSAINH
jgi:DNA-binding protein WhiA